MEKKHLILIVDDQAGTVAVLSRHLFAVGCDVMAVRTGLEVVEFLASTTPDVIVLDMMLEGESGLDLCEKIHRLPAMADVPILFFSGYDENEKRLAGLKVGARDFVSKSSDVREIVTKIALHLKLADNERLLRLKNQELSDAYLQLHSTQEQVVQAEKQALLGKLSAGVAHEVSTPMGFIISNLKMLNASARDIYRVLDAEKDLIELCEEAGAGDRLNEKAAAIRKLRVELQVDAMRLEIDSMCRDSLDGIELLARVASDLKEFSRDDKHDMQPSDINAIMDKALNLVRVELGTRIAVVRQYAELPSVMCIPSRIMQVFLILIVNSLQAISDKGTINVTTLCGCERVKAVVEDTGTGVSPENIGLMFDPFFTTKPADKGTGLGLTIAQKIVTFHGGTITATSQAGKGTTMTVELPCQQLVTGV